MTRGDLKIGCRYRWTKSTLYPEGEGATVWAFSRGKVLILPDDQGMLGSLDAYWVAPNELEALEGREQAA